MNSDDESDYEHLEDYSQVFYGSSYEEKYCVTDENGEIPLVLQYGDYYIVETETLYGYEPDYTEYFIRVDSNGIYFITEAEFDWDSMNNDDSIQVKTAVINDKIGKVEEENEEFTLNHIDLNDDTLGTTADDLPTTAYDGDVIKVFFSGGLYYNVHFMIYDGNGELVELTDMNYTVYKFVYDGEMEGYYYMLIDYNRIADTIIENWDFIKDIPEYGYDWFENAAILIYAAANWDDGPVLGVRLGINQWGRARITFSRPGV